MSDVKKKLMELLEKVEGEGGKLVGFGMCGHISCDDEEKDMTKFEVIKKMPMKPEWKKMHDDAEALVLEAREAAKAAMELAEKNMPLANAKAELMWATIKNDTGIFANMRISDDAKTITFYGDDLPKRRPAKKAAKKVAKKK